ncbi:hypothetical protein V494_02819 [Pseudogymnoascus sp. VKM F-4513 (FW-928)]|nr:hypothetical protein V494_02819 [Pseudogymnoascus sp. VKM F-4513 (FW-928)]
MEGTNERDNIDNQPISRSYRSQEIILSERTLQKTTTFNMNIQNTRKKRSQQYDLISPDGNETDISDLTVVAETCERCSQKDDEELTMEKINRKAALEYAMWRRRYFYVVWVFGLLMMIYTFVLFGFASPLMLNCFISGISVKTFTSPPIPPNATTTSAKRNNNISKTQQQHQQNATTTSAKRNNNISKTQQQHQQNATTTSAKRNNNISKTQQQHQQNATTTPAEPTNNISKTQQQHQQNATTTTATATTTK